MNFIDACANGNYDRVTRLRPIHNYINYKQNLALRMACKNGHHEIAKYLVENGAIINESEDCAFRWSCRNGHLTTAKMLYDLGVDITQCKNYAFNYACINGHLNIVKWLIDIGHDLFLDNYVGAFINSCKNGHIEVAKLLQQYIALHDINMDDLFVSVCQNGHLIVAKWLVECGVNVELRGYDAFVKSGKHIEVIKWLVDMGIKITADVIFVNYHSHSLSTVKLLHELGANLHYVIEKYDICSKNTCLMIEWWCDKKLILFKNIKDQLLQCFEFGCINTIKMIHNSGIDIHTTMLHYSDPLIISCYYGHFELAQWLYYLDDYYLTNKYFINQAFVVSCNKNNIDITKWLYTLETSNIVKCDNHKFFILHKPYVRITNRILAAFKIACNNNHLELSQWLYTLFDIGKDDLLAIFVVSCKYGCLDIAKWLFQNCNVTTSHLNIAFQQSCSNGHIYVAKWLFSCYNKISYDVAFVCACNNKKFKIAKWLYDIDNLVISRCIKRIRTKYIRYDIIGISPDSEILFECIRNNERFPNIDDIDDVEDIVIHSLAHYNMLRELTILERKFSFIDFEVCYGYKVTNLSINRVQIKSARTHY